MHVSQGLAAVVDIGEPAVDEAHLEPVNLMVPAPALAPVPASVPSYVRSEHRIPIPDAILRDPAGKYFSLAQELDADEPVLLNFVSTRCTAECAPMSATFAEVQRQLGSDMRRLRLISVAIQPRYDTPAALRAFSRLHQAGPAWIFLTGRTVEITPVLQAFGVPADFHESVAFLRAGSRAPWVRIEGTVTPAELIAEYRQLVAR